MGIAKVTLNNETLMDITDDTVTASGLMLGDTAHGANGESVTGTYVPVTYDVATETTDGLMSASDKVKLNGVATGAEVNQNAFSNVKVGNTTIAADSKTDTLTLTAGTNITLTPNATSDSVTIAVNGMPSKVSDLDNDSGFITSSGTASNVSGTVEIEHGGTGATSASAARTNLGLGSAATASTSSTVGNNSSLPTGAAIQSYVTGLGYTTNTGTVTSVATGAGLTGGTITGSGTIKADLKSETKSSLTAASKGSTANREYAVGLDANGDLSVNVPWENTQTVTGVKGSSESTYRTGNVSISATNLGLGNVENKSSATIRSELTKSNVTTALGFTPYTQDEVNALVSSVFTYKGTKSTYSQVSALTGMKTGDVWQVTEDNSEYVYNGSAWEKLGPTIDLSGYLTSISVAGQSLTPSANSITAAQLKTALGLGSAAYVDTESTVANDAKLPTGAAVKSFVEGKGYTTNTGTITEIKMNGSSKGTSGSVDLGTVLTSHQTIKQDGVTGATVNRFGTCGIAAGTAAKTVAITTGTFSLETGAKVTVKFTYANTANNPTLNVGGTGAKNIFHRGSRITTGTNKALLAGTCEFVYDGTQYHLIGNYHDTTYTAATTAPGNVASSSAVGTSANYARQDHTHGIALATGDSNGQVKIAGTNISVKGWNTAATYDVESTLANDAKLPTGAAVTAAINDAVDFGTVGSNQNPVYFNNGDPTPIAFTFGVDDDQHVQVAWDGDAPEIVIPTTSALAIDSGGTGATTAAGARTNLGLGGAALKEVVSMVQDDDNLVTNGAVKRYVDGLVDGTVTSHDVSGTVLSFTAANAQPVKSLVLNLEPTQSGTGDPSPSNIRPISGYDSVSVVRSGKNLLSSFVTNGLKAGVTWALKADGTFTTSGTASGNSQQLGTRFHLGTGSYAMTGCPSGGGSSTYYMRALVYDGDTLVGSYTDTGSGASFTITSATHEVFVFANIINGETAPSATWMPMIRLSTESATYEPYQGTTYPISLSSAGTVYGGTLDVTTGELTVTHVGMRLTSTNQTWASAGSVGSGYRFYSTLSPACATSARQIMTSHWYYESGNNGNWGTYQVYNGVFFVKNQNGEEGLTSWQAFMNWLDANDAQICYPLATPITYQLTPTEVTTLLGDNTIWMDAEGTLELTYEDVASSIKYTEVGELGTAATHNASDTLVPDATLPTGVAVYNHTANRTFYGTCSTAAGTAAKVVELEDGDGFELKPGVVVGVKFSATNTANNMTLNVNNTGAIGISYIAGTRYTGATANITGSVSYVFYYMYDGTYWTFFNHSGNYANNSNTVPAAQCETAAGTAAKAATCTNHTLTANTYLHFNIRYANTVKGAITMNVDSSGAKPIYINGAASSASNYTLPAGTYIAFYNGTNWYFDTNGGIPFQMGGGDTGNTTSAASSDSVSTIILREIAAIESKPPGIYTNSLSWADHVNGYSISIAKERYGSTTDIVYHGSLIQRGSDNTSCIDYPFTSNGTWVNLNKEYDNKYVYAPSKLSYSGNEDATFAAAVYAYAKADANYGSMFTILRSGTHYLAIVQYASSTYGTVVLINYGTIIVWALVNGTWTRYTLNKTQG